MNEKHDRMIGDIVAFMGNILTSIGSATGKGFSKEQAHNLSRSFTGLEVSMRALDAELKHHFGSDSRSRLVAFARQELEIHGIGKSTEDMDRAICKSVMDVVMTYASHGHGGMTNEYTLHLLEKLLRFQPLTPLQGTDDEWEPVGPPCDECGKQIYQNKRQFSVMKHGKDGKAVDTTAIIIKDDTTGLFFTDPEFSIKEITFPYTPEMEIVNRSDLHNKSAAVH